MIGYQLTTSDRSYRGSKTALKLAFAVEPSESLLTQTRPDRILNPPMGESMAEVPQEKRSTRRFALRLPVSVNYSTSPTPEKPAQTRDVSARGICFYVESSIEAGSPIEFTLTLPPEITLTESIHVRCKGKVVRVDGSQGKMAVAAVIDEYEFLSQA